MSTEISNRDERLKEAEQLNNEPEAVAGAAKDDDKRETQNSRNSVYTEPEIETNDTTDSISINAAEFSYEDTSEEAARPKLASHHRTHRHHHHHHHSDASREVKESVTASTELMEASIVKESAVIESVAANSDIEEAAPKKRIPLAAHHRSHRHHSSGEHHHSSGEHHHRSSRRRHHSSRRSVSKAQYHPTSNSDFSGHVETMGIDEEEFARLHSESMEEMKAQNTASLDRERIADADRTVSNSVSETVSHTEEKENQGNSDTTARLGETILAAREANPRATRKASSIKSTGSRSRQKKANVRTIITRILIGIVAFLVACIAILLFMRARGQSSMTPNGDNVEIVMPDEEIPEDADVEDNGKTVTYKGRKYRWNENLTTFLILGTDRTLEQQENGETAAGKNGQADSILLAVIDNTNKKISFINVNRDTFIPVAEYTPDGDYAGEKKMQICLSYAYGKDDETSCKYTAQAVSKYLYGMPIDYYVRLSYDAIPVLNDSIGGVTLTVAEDLTTVDPSLPRGATVTLAGSQALTYVRWRDTSIVETNENRISRQKQYLNTFMARAIECTRADLLLPFGLYANAKPYMTTNVSTSQLTYITSKVLEYGVGGDAIHSIPGKSVEGSENHVEFYPDQTALYEQVLDTFYNKEA